MPTTKHQFIDSAGGWDAETSYHRIFDPRLTDYMPCVQMFGEDHLNDAYDFERSGFESVEIHLTLSGSGELEYDGKRYLLTPGSGFFINCEPYQHYWCRRGENWSCLWLHMTGGSAAKIVSTCLAQGGPIFLDEGGRIEEKLRALEAVLTANAPDQDFVLAPMLDDLLGTLLQPALARGQRQIPAELRQAAQILEAEYATPLSLDELAARVYMNKYTLLRAFSRYYGLTPKAYQQRCRLQQARFLLRNTGFSVAEIARRVGFGSASHFNDVFRKQEGCPPMAYRHGRKMP
ncbi:MAG: helix-turn-helix transcriptional regulator [Clostridia bacterium]|nr:helix-turn-helix transcriptional regulator [Clostridia bacterium]